MNPLSYAALATVFKVIGSILGIPSLAVLVWWVVHVTRQRPSTVPLAPDVGPNPDALLLMLQGLATGIGAVGRFFEALGELLFNLLAAGAGVGLVLGLACWLTGRGLHAQALWARGSAFVLLSGLLLVALLLALSLPAIGRLLMLALVAFCALGLHTVWQGVGRLPG